MPHLVPDDAEHLDAIRVKEKLPRVQSAKDHAKAPHGGVMLKCGAATMDKHELNTKETL